MNKIRQPFYDLVWEASKGWNNQLFDVPAELLEAYSELIVKKCGEIIDNHYEPVYNGKQLNEYFKIYE